MSSVHDATYEVLRAFGMTTIFGNPGSNELPFLDELPSDFRYVLALHEGAGLAMADGYAQATGRPVLVSLHAAAGVGQAMGCLVNSQVSGTPLVIMSGQQFRAMLTLEGQLTNRDAAQLPRPLVKWSFEAPTPASVPAVMARAAHYAVAAPAGPVFVSVPLDVLSVGAGGVAVGLAACHHEPQRVRFLHAHLAGHINDPGVGDTNSTCIRQRRQIGDEQACRRVRRFSGEWHQETVFIIAMVDDDQGVFSTRQH